MADAAVLRISGEVASGLGKGAYFIQLEWVRARLAEVMGAPPFPGTLNLRVAADARGQLFAARQRLAPILPPDAGNCPGYLASVHLRAAAPGARGVREVVAWAVLPEATAHADIIEIVSPHFLREHLSLGDGDRIELLVRIS
jgi:CTP-dependent riboflavin kinase